MPLLVIGFAAALLEFSWLESGRLAATFPPPVKEAGCLPSPCRSPAADRKQAPYRNSWRRSLRQLILSSFCLLVTSVACGAGPDIKDSSPLQDKAVYFQQDLRDKHLLEGLYVSIVPAAPAGT